MKNLPDIFPIRYSLIADVSDFKEFPSFVEETLYIQLIKHLQTNAIEQKKLKFLYNYITNGDLKSPDHTLRLIMLTPDRNWRETELWRKSVFNSLNDILPGLSCSLFCVTSEAFRLQAISYLGTGGIPYYQILLDEKRRKDEKLQTKFNINPFIDFPEGPNKPDIETFSKYFEELKNGKMSEDEFWTIKEEYSRPFYIHCPDSYIWHILDTGFNNGIYYEADAGNEKIEKDMENMVLNHKINSDHKVPVLVCKNIESLCLEEMFRLYKLFNFCNNCGKALPFNYKGFNCHKSDNPECDRERNRIRKRKQIHKR